MLSWLLLVLGAHAALCATSRATRSWRARENQTFCNPVNLRYRMHGKCRAAADFTLVPWKGVYWLFTTDSQGGYWRSTDLVTWSLVGSFDLPDNPVAPTAFVSNETMYYT